MPALEEGGAAFRNADVSAVVRVEADLVHNTDQSCLLKGEGELQGSGRGITFVAPGQTGIAADDGTRISREHADNRTVGQLKSRHALRVDTSVARSAGVVVVALSRCRGVEARFGAGTTRIDSTGVVVLAVAVVLATARAAIGKMGATGSGEARVVSAGIIVIAVCRSPRNATKPGVAGFEAVTDRVVAAGERLAQSTTQKGIAPLLAVAGIAVVAFQRLGFDAPEFGIAGLQTIAEVAVVATQRVTILASFALNAMIEADACVLIATNQWLSFQAALDRVTGLFSVARFFIVAFEGLSFAATLSLNTGLLAVAQVRIVADEGFPLSAANLWVARLLPVAGVVVAAIEGLPGHALSHVAADRSTTEFQSVAEVTIVAGGVFICRDHRTDQMLRVAYDHLAQTNIREMTIAISDGLAPQTGLELLWAIRGQVTGLFREIDSGKIGIGLFRHKIAQQIRPKRIFHYLTDSDGVAGRRAPGRKGRNEQE